MNQTKKTMKSLLMIFALSLSFLCIGLSQTSIPSPTAEIACPDPAIVSLDLKWENPAPGQNFHVYNIVGIIQNQGNTNFDPAISNFTAFWYANSGGGYKLVKSEQLPVVIPAGGAHTIAFKGRIKPGQKVPAFILRIAPTINVPANQSDCDLSNNKKAFSL